MKSGSSSVIGGDTNLSLKRSQAGISGMKIGSTVDALLIFNANFLATQNENTPLIDRQLR